MSPIRLEIAAAWGGAPARPGEHVSMTLTMESDHLEIRVEAPLHGDPEPTGPAGPTWGLWEHEVVELFIVGADERYTEIEVSPSGHHLVLQLEGRRNIVARELPLDLEVTRQQERWTGVARLHLDLLPPGPHTLNAYAIHGSGHARTYLAWAPVPGPSPDFHRLECFVPVALG